MKTPLTARLTAILALACALTTAACSEDFSLTEPVAAPAFAKGYCGGRPAGPTDMT